MLDKTAISTELEKLEDDAAKVTVTVSAEEVDKRIAAAYKDLSHRYRIPGFRPGRAPRKVIDNHLGKDYAHATATENCLSETYMAAVDSCEVISLTEPQVNAEEIFKDGEAYTYTIDITLQPEIELSSYDPVDVFMPPEEATKAEVDAQLEILRGYQYNFNEVERAVEADDYTILDMTAKRGEEQVDQWTSSERYYQLGKGFLPAAFDEQLIGMNPGDSKSFTITEADGMEDGDTDFEVTVAKVREKEFAEIDDEFAKNCGADDLDGLIKSLSEDIEKEKAAARPRLLEQRCAEEISKRLVSDPKPEYVEGVHTEMLQQLYSQLQSAGIPLDFYVQQLGMTIDQFKEDIQRQSNDQARDYLAFDALARHLELEITEEDLEKEFLAAANSNDMDAAALRERFEQDGRMTGLISAMRRAKAAEWLTENANVTIRETPDEEDEAAKAVAKAQAEGEEAAAEIIAALGSDKEEAPAEEAASEEAPAEE